MLDINEYGAIRLTRGDTAKLSVNIFADVTGEAYTIASDDIIRFTVKTSADVADMCFQKVLKGTTDIKIEPSDTKNLKYGSYVYDVELTTKDGDVFTVIPPSKFVLTKEVSW